MTERPRGAGRGGGLLFAAVLGLTAAIAWGSLEGVIRAVVVGGLALGVALVLVSTARRR